MTPEREGRAGRRIALLIAAAGLLAIAAPWIVTWTGLERRFEFLFYLISMAAFFWALVVLLQIWQKRGK